MLEYKELIEIKIGNNQNMKPDLRVKNKYNPKTNKQKEIKKPSLILPLLK